MCGIFGQIAKLKANKDNLNVLVEHAKQRGMDSSGLIYNKGIQYCVDRADYEIEKLLKRIKP